MSSFMADVRQAFRVLAKSPGFTLVAVAALALGIGANTAIFSVVNAVLLRPLPYPDANRMMLLERGYKLGTGDSTSIPKFMVWKAQNKVFDDLSAFDFGGTAVNLSGVGLPEQLKGLHVTGSYFQLFGVSPLAGRTFTTDEDRPGGAHVVVISEGLWKRRFGSRPDIVGQSLTLSTDPYTVIGILPGAFRPEKGVELWFPLQPDPNSISQANYLRVAGRLKSGVNLQAAKAQMKLAGEQFRRLFPKSMGSDESVTVVPMQDAMVGDVRPALMILTGAVVFVLLIACANVANLLLARAAGRQREIAIRSAIGASRGRVIRQLLTESVLLALIGGSLGMLLGSWGIRVLLALSPGNLPRASELTASAVWDWQVLAFTVSIALLTGIMFGLVPALQISKLDLSSALKESSGRSGTGLRQNRARGLLIITEIALALVLLIGAALMIRSFAGLRQVNPGFDPHHVITMELSVAGQKYTHGSAMEDFGVRAVRRIESLPGVTAASPTPALPLMDIGIDLPFTIEGKPPKPGDQFNGEEYWRYVGPHFFAVFRIPVLRGRSFTEQDAGNSAPVVIINEAMAKKYWSKEDPIGQRILIGKGLGPEFDDRPRQIVGVVGSVREARLDRPPDGVMYIPFTQVSDALTRFANSLIPTIWAIRTAGDPGSLSNAIQREFLSVDGQLPAAHVRSMDQLVAEATARQNFNMLLLSIFAGVALLLAAIGIYGLMAYSVEQQTHEIGIRLALGAGRPEMLRMIVVQGMRLVGVGLLAGLAAAVSLTRLLSALLFEVKPTDPVTFISVATVLAGIALAATYIPARRATRVDPLIALRYE